MNFEQLQLLKEKVDEHFKNNFKMNKDELINLYNEVLKEDL